MENTPTSSSENPFLSRGCCSTPRVYTKNENVYQHRCSKFDTFDWLASMPLPDGFRPIDVAEVRFKNSRKDFFKIPADLELNVGDIVAVEASPGHDIGIVSMTGEIVRFQMKKKKINPNSEDLKKVYRRARLTDIEKWIASVEMETSIMFKARELAEGLGLRMKINAFPSFWAMAVLGTLKAAFSLERTIWVLMV